MDKLSATERQAVVDFLAVANSSRDGVLNSVEPKTALKFLIARKFDVTRAVQLYDSHETVRARESVGNIQCPNLQQVESLKRELQSCKFKIFPMPADCTGVRIAMFTASKHIPSLTTHQATLQGVLFQLDAVLESYDPATAIKQGGSFIFIYNFVGSDYSNFDYELAVKMVNALKGAYPVQLKVALIVDEPLWFVEPLRMFKLQFLQEKLRDRVHSVSVSQLQLYMPSTILPEELGGELKFDNQSSAALVDQLLERSKNTTSVAYVTQEADELENSSLPLRNFVQNVNSNRLNAEYRSFDFIPHSGTFNSFFLPENIGKNRYNNIGCYDHSRVILPLIDGMPHSDYIHANYVDGYMQKGAFICTQGPLIVTLYDFWRMVWQNQCLVIVMTTQLQEGWRDKCYPYWPADEKTSHPIGNFSITNDRVEKCPNWTISHLTLENNDTNEKRSVVHLLFTSWPDFGVPSSPTEMLHFRDQVRHYQKELLKGIQWTGHPAGPPIIVHCSAGVGRSGTFITIDTSIQRLQATGRVDIKGTVAKIRSQRALAIQTDEQYRFCFWALIKFANANGMLSIDDIAQIIQ